jgi:hypothetical protein
MAQIDIETPFGRVRLSSPAGTEGEVREVEPRLAEGMRLSGCRVGILTVAFSGGESVEVEISARLAPQMEAHRTAGDGVTGWEVEGPGIAGAFGLPEAARFRTAFGLELAGFNQHATRAAFRLRATDPVVAEIPFAAAWTDDPMTEADGVAPWTALDRVLPD